ncbi:hypothetical protein BD410DRAFT_723967 [Rickenella mellea]|uniref:Protein kinase domain-containing protein n=1 Tax=Rickenella mellea TaxID=50990 RepID=A0A4Y7Q3G3_9AGAM|nr:hypothetical protein BD410DRAFT_723967 [Rickenella mellea]
MRIENGQVELWDLNTAERWWRDRENVLKQHGYKLRPRYRGEWTPSWFATGKDFMSAEDGIRISVLRDATMDATRVSDGSLVMLKKVSNHTSETPIALYFSEPELRQCPENHCVPILDRFPTEAEPSIDIIVMPFLFQLNEPRFESVDQVVDFFEQTLDGLTFMHSKDVAHRDCAFNNIMHDGIQLYPDGVHPAAVGMNPTYTGYARTLRRADVPSIKYYFTDFGLSTHFKHPNQSRLVLGGIAADEDVPELSNTIPYDPFRVDIFTLGNVYKKEFLKCYSNLEFLRLLVKEMTRRNPRKRPTAAEARDRFHFLLHNIPWYKRVWRLQTGRETQWQCTAKDLRFVASYATRKLVRFSCEPEICLSRQSYSLIRREPWVLVTTLMLAISLPACM